MYKIVLLIFFVSASYASEQASSNWLRRLFACCCCGEANRYHLLEAVQSEESLIRERDTLIKNEKHAQIRLDSARKHYDAAKVESFREHAQKRIKLAQQNCLHARRALDDFNRQHPGLPQEVKSKK